MSVEEFIKKYPWAADCPTMKPVINMNVLDNVLFHLKLSENERELKKIRDDFNSINCISNDPIERIMKRMGY